MIWIWWRRSWRCPSIFYNFQISRCRLAISQWHMWITACAPLIIFHFPALAPMLCWKRVLKLFFGPKHIYILLVIGLRWCPPFCAALGLSPSRPCIGSGLLITIFSRVVKPSLDKLLNILQWIGKLRYINGNMLINVPKFHISHWSLPKKLQHPY